MKVVALISGGKDSCFNAMQCIAAGHEIVALANVSPRQQTEINSFMYQSVGFEAIKYVADAMELPLFQIETDGCSEDNQAKEYVITENDEVEDLYKLLEKVKDATGIEGVSCGAILSDYQRIRVENVCSRLGLTSLAYLWRRDQKELLQEMIKCEIDAVVIKVAGMGLDPQRHLGRSIRLLEPHLLAMSEQFGLNVCGEGGEYETLTLDCPLYKSRIVIEESQQVHDTTDPICPVGYLKLNKIRLDVKLPQLDLTERFAHLPLKKSNDYLSDISEEKNVQISETDNIINPGTVAELTSSDIQQNVNTSLSGQGWLHIGGITGQSSESIQTAVNKAIEKLNSSLQEHSMKLQDLCSITLYVSDLSQYAEINRIYCETIKHVNPPTRACVQVPLPDDCPILLDAVAWQPSHHSTGDLNLTCRQNMHVQSISHWCPANIGPYSQVTKIGDFIHVAGQISLVPGSMEMVQGGIEAQCKLSLRHVERLISGIDPNCDLRSVVQGICYITDPRFARQARTFWEDNTNNSIMEYVVVSRLPRDALIEWHVWAHVHNNRFDYEETGEKIHDWSISVIRRWNSENNTSAIIGRVDNSDKTATLTPTIFRETTDFIFTKLMQNQTHDLKATIVLKIFIPCSTPSSFHNFTSSLEECRNQYQLSYTIIPVPCLGGRSSYLSICGVRLQ